MKTVKVLIADDGPAGTIAGYQLARTGVDVCLIDKSHFPRRKVCGGGLTQHALNKLPFDVSSIIHQTVYKGQVMQRTLQIPGWVKGSIMPSPADDGCRDDLPACIRHYT